MYVHDNCQLMFHTYSGVFAGKGNEQEAEVAAVGKWFGKVMQRICTPFLSDAEVAPHSGWGDFWLDSDEIRRRMRRVASDQAKPAAKGGSPQIERLMAQSL